MRKWVEFLRAFAWVQTDKTRTRIAYTIRFGRRTFRLKETQRLYFGRWGRWKWRTTHRELETWGAPPTEGDDHVH